MRSWSAEQLALAAGARLIDGPASAHGPERVVIDSREVGAGALFVGLRGHSVDGGRYAREALAEFSTRPVEDALAGVQKVKHVGVFGEVTDKVADWHQGLVGGDDSRARPSVGEVRGKAHAAYAIARSQTSNP